MFTAQSLSPQMTNTVNVVTTSSSFGSTGNMFTAQSLSPPTVDLGNIVKTSKTVGSVGTMFTAQALSPPTTSMGLNIVKTSQSVVDRGTMLSHTMNTGNLMEESKAPSSGMDKTIPQALSLPTTGTVLKAHSSEGPKKSNDAPVLFAVPAPSSVGNGLLCLCRKVYWTNGSLMHCAYSPVTKNEAAKLLRDPSVISILSNPVTGSNLLTVAANGAIIGVQQTIGYLNPQANNAQNVTMRKLSDQKTKTISGKSPNEAQKVPTQTAALPQPTKTPASAKQRTTPQMLPKIDAVFTLADTGLNTTSAKQKATAIPLTKVLAKETLRQPHVMSNKIPLVNRIPAATPTKQSTSSPNSVPTQETKLSQHLPNMPNKVPSDELGREVHLIAAPFTKAPSSNGVTKRTHTSPVRPFSATKDTSEQSNVLSDVQNKVSENENVEDNTTKLSLKRKAETEKPVPATEKKRKVTTPAAANPALKVKFLWNSRSSSDKVTDKQTSSKKRIAKDPSKCTVREQEVETQTGDRPLDTPSQVKLDTAYGKIIISNPQGLKFSSLCDTRRKLVSIDDKLPSLSAQKKLNVDDLLKLGCHPKCTILQGMNVRKKKKLVTKQERAAAMPSLDALTHHPDFNHIPTVDKVTYLKELLRLQRAALGIPM